MKITVEIVKSRVSLEFSSSSHLIDEPAFLFIATHFHNFFISLEILSRMNSNPGSNASQGALTLSAFSQLPFAEAKKVVDMLAHLFPLLNIPLNGLLPLPAEMHRKVCRS